MKKLLHPLCRYATSFLLPLTLFAADDLQSLSDEFNDATSLDDFVRVYRSEGAAADQLQTLDINSTQAGRMVMMPYSSTWYQNYRGELTFKMVTGDFVVTTEVEPTRRSGTGAPQSTYSLGGIMVRTPRPAVTNAASWTPGGENYVFLSLGAAGIPGMFQFEVKTTVNSASTLVPSPGTNRAIIQVARIGSALIMLQQRPGGPWTVHRRYQRPDMPASLQVGLTCYTDFATAAQYPPPVHNQTRITNGNPDLIVGFEYIRYARPLVPDHLLGRDLTNPNQVSDSELLGFLGAHANEAAPLQPPAFTLEPDNARVQPGSTVTLRSAASGTRPLAYQWQKDNVDLPGATSTSLILTNVQLPHAGAYQVRISNSAGVAQSRSAYVAVQTAFDYLPQRTNAPAEISVGTLVLAADPPRFGLNLRDPSEQNNFTSDPGFEPTIIRRQHTATGGGSNYIANASGATTSHYRTMADGFFEGASVRVYRPSTNGGPLGFVRSNIVLHYITDGFRRLNPEPIANPEFTDNDVVPGQNYEYQVRAVNGSALVSTNFDNPLILTGAPLPGFTTATNSRWSGSFYGRNGSPPATPANVRLTAMPGAIRLNWNSNIEPDLAGYYVYRRSVSTQELSRVVLDANGPPVQAGDIYFLEMQRANPPVERMHDRLNASSLNDAWRFLGGPNWPYGLGGSYRRDPTTVCPENGGQSSMQISNPGTHEVSLRQARFSSPQFYAGFYPALVTGRIYRVDVWLRQSGVPTGTVAFRLSQHYSSVHHSWTVTGDWQKYTHTFVAPPPPTNGSIAEIVLAFAGPGTVWVDNLFLYEDADSNPSTYPVFAVRPAAEQALRDFQPSLIRIWTGVDTEYWGVSVDDWTRAEPEVALHWEANTGRRTPDDPYKLPTALKMCRDAGADPWLIGGSFFAETEWRDLMEYLAAPYDPAVDSPASKPFAYRRFTQGQTQPWTDAFSRIYLEYGNELWNPAFQWNFGSGSVAGQFSEYFFNAAQASPWYAAVSNKFEFIVNGWLVSPDSNYGYGPSASRAAPHSQFNDIAVYIGGWEAGISAGGSNLTEQGFQDYMLYVPSFLKYYLDQHAAVRDLNRNAGVPYQIAIYEGGPGYANPSPGQPFEPISEIYGKSLSAAVATLDTYLYNSRLGIDPQAYFSFGPGYNWSSHATIERGYSPHANWLALQLRNQSVRGSMVATTIHRSPVVDIPARTNSAGQVQVPAFPNTPLLAAYAFRDQNRWSVFVLSRSVSEAIPVTLRLPFASVSRTTLSQITGDPRSGNSTNLLIVPVTESLTNFSDRLAFVMPPASIYLFTFDDAAAPSDELSATISQALGQADPTSYPQLNFEVVFNRPVSGFSSNDVQLAGTAGATRVTLTETGARDGTTFQVAVSGMARSGNVIVQIPAGAATDSEGRASVAATLIDNEIDYRVPEPQNLLLAWDNFDSPVTNSFQPLHQVNSGSGWATAWQAQNFVPASHTNGYALRSDEPLSSGSLLTTATYATGGRGYEMSTRELNVDQAFAGYRVFNSRPSTIGLEGTTLWLSFLLRKESDDFAPVHLMLVNASGMQNYGQINIGAGYYGQVSSVNNLRYWTLAVRNATNGTDYLRGNVPVIIGQPAHLVLRMDFGISNTISLFVNPTNLGGAAPVQPNASVTVANAEVQFRSVRFYAGLGGGWFTGDGIRKGSLDEIRFGDTFAAVTPESAAPLILYPPSSVEITPEPSSATDRPVLLPQRLAQPNGSLLRVYFANPATQSGATNPTQFELWSAETVVPATWVRLPATIAFEGARAYFEIPVAREVPSRFFRIRAP